MVKLEVGYLSHEFNAVSGPMLANPRRGKPKATGSGKHNNWSMITDTGINILDPGKTPAENTQFLIFLTAVIKAVDEYADVLRISVASAGNDHRLGANEAPPAVVSVFLGDELTEVLKSIENDEYFAGSRAVQMDIGAKVLPHFVKDNTDRNRTSPFAFTGNKFEFRMLGSEASVANPNIILNTAVAECVHQFAEQLKDVPEDKMEDAIHELIKKTIIDHKRVIFNGNGYTDEWIEEATKRGLFNLKSTPDALPQWIADKNIELFTKGYEACDLNCIESLADMYLKGLYVEKDKKKALELYSISIYYGSFQLYFKVGIIKTNLSDD